MSEPKPADEFRTISADDWRRALESARERVAATKQRLIELLSKPNPPSK